MSKLNKVIAVIPAFNEEKTIGKVLKRVKKFVDEIILIDDSSHDKTGEIAKKYAFVIRNKENRGYSKSLNSGFKFAQKRKAGIIVTLDADGQHLPEEIPLFTDPIRKGEADVVVGVRPYAARFMEKVFGFYAKKKIGIQDPLCGFKAYSSKVYKRVGFFDNIDSVGTQLMFLAAKKGYKLKELPISLKRRKDKPRFGNQIKGNLKLFKAYLGLKKYLKSSSVL